MKRGSTRRWRWAAAMLGIALLLPLAPSQAKKHRPVRDPVHRSVGEILAAVRELQGATVNEISNFTGLHFLDVKRLLMRLQSTRLVFGKQKRAMGPPGHVKVERLFLPMSPYGGQGRTAYTRAKVRRVEEAIMNLIDSEKEEHGADGHPALGLDTLEIAFAQIGVGRDLVRHALLNLLDRHDLYEHEKRPTGLPPTAHLVYSTVPDPMALIVAQRNRNLHRILSSLKD